VYLDLAVAVATPRQGNLGLPPAINKLGGEFQFPSIRFVPVAAFRIQVIPRVPQHR